MQYIKRAIMCFNGSPMRLIVHVSNGIPSTGLLPQL